MNDSRLFRTGCHSVCLFLILYLGSALTLARAGVNAWTTGGPYGGHIRALAVDNAGAMYAGIFGRGLFKSTDGGAHWTPINTGLTDLFVNAIVADGSGSIYVGTGEKEPGSSAVGGARIYKSSNGGSTWSAVFSSPGEHVCVTALAVDGGGIVYAGTLGHGVLFSANGGLSWTPCNSGLTGLKVQTLVAHGSIIYSGTEGEGIFRLVPSQVAGPSWSPVNTGLPDLFVNALALDALGTVYAGTNGGVFFTNNGGASWNEYGFGLAGWCVNSLAIDGSGQVYAGMCFGGVAKILFSILWVPANEGLFNSNVEALAIDGSGSLYAGTDGGGVFRSSDGAMSWDPVNSGLPHLDAWALAVDSFGSVYAGTMGGAFKSSDGGTSWDPISSGLFTLSIPSLIIDDYFASVFAADFGFGVYKSVNGGASWDPANSGIPTFASCVPPSALFIYKLAADRAGMVYAVGFDCAKGAQLFKSADGGASWTTPDPTPKASPVSLLVDNFGALYAGTFQGLWKSADGGAGYVHLSPNLPDPSLLVSALAIDPADLEYPGTVYAGTWGGGVLRSTDGGMTWSHLGLSGQGIVSLLVRGDSGDLYAGTWGQGVLKSTDGGVTWQPFNKGIENSIVLSLANDPGDQGRIYAGLSYGSVYQIQDVAPPSASFVLNPFAPGISQEVTFESTSTGAITSYLWDFGDGQQGSGPSMTHSYSTAGTFTVTLTASGPGGTATSAPMQVKVSKKPSKRLQVMLLGPSTGAEGSSLAYQAMLSGNISHPVHYQFNWGDKVVTDWIPSSSTSYSWDKPGRYRVKARVLGSQGKPSGWSRPVTVNITNGSPTILGQHEVDPDVPCYFTADPVSTSSAPYRYSFSFDGGATWSEYSLNPTSVHSWSEGGTYCVKVKASDKRGKLSPESDCFYVTVAFSNLPALPPTPGQGQ